MSLKHLLKRCHTACSNNLKLPLWLITFIHTFAPIFEKGNLIKTEMRKLFNFSALAIMSLAFLPASNLLAQHDHDQEHDHNTDHIETVEGQEAHAEQYPEMENEEGDYDPTPVIMHHISDAHGFHIYGEGHDAVSVPLPVILWTEKGLVTFMSSEFHHDSHGHHVVEKSGMYFVNFHEDIFQLDNPNEKLSLDEEGHPTNTEPLDFSITKNVFTLLLAGLILLLIFGTAARKYKKTSGHKVPKGIASFVEPLILFVRDDIAKQNVGEKKHAKYMPFLLTIFFLIWVLNLMGLVPFFPFSANLSGNIAFTMSLSLIALVVVSFSGNKAYWKHIFLPKPWGVWPILMPIEFASNVIIKFFALMIRLFANITAGHIIVLSLISLIFIFQSVGMAAVAVPFALFISVLELLVAALQAYIFTLLVALFLGQAVAEDHH
jgi:F-type H+-transporting ATPase subunit a